MLSRSVTTSWARSRSGNESACVSMVCVLAAMALKLKEGSGNHCTTTVPDKHLTPRLRARLRRRRRRRPLNRWLGGNKPIA